MPRSSSYRIISGITHDTLNLVREYSYVHHTRRRLKALFCPAKTKGPLVESSTGECTTARATHHVWMMRTRKQMPFPDTCARDEQWGDAITRPDKVDHLGTRDDDGRKNLSGGCESTGGLLR